MLEWSILRSLIVLLRARLRSAHHERGATTLEYVLVTISALAVVALVFKILSDAARTGANNISIPGN